MSPYDRKEDEIRRMLESSHPALPPDLALRAAERGRRLLRRRRAVRVAAWGLLVVALAVFCVWAATARPWAVPPVDVAPPLRDW
ncbi:hypothetical protein QZH56_11690 [Streptomyces olivoreticuli]|uniref:hypothetical protein n=1 Tax=Streptomyces olivoreticuli TaxID=68246 RepID=UPI00265AF749|nr:hypothetical protein [Streptomyces olivoreticuli]WKK26191.1 hypothetical protein QZH56_11690 [Streptomyces olivoreticuli]